MRLALVLFAVLLALPIFGMLDFHFDFDRPWYLLLLLALPILWGMAYGSLSGLGRMRRWLAITVRSLVFTLIVAALAEMQWVRVSDRLTVLYLLDQSLSVSEAQQQAMTDYINQSVRAHRAQHPRDRVGVILFGREPAIELPPFDENQQLPRHTESFIERDYTNLAGAMRLAEASFPHDAAKRIVIVSDGNENVGDALEQAKSLAEAGVGIDVVPIRSAARGEVLVEKVAIPPNVRKSQPFDVRVVLNNTSPGGGTVAGRLKITRRAGDQESTLSDEAVTLAPGKRVFTIREEIEAPEFYTYDARFSPDNPADDTLSQNNLASTFTHVRGSGQVLLIEDFENRGEFDHMVEQLRAANLEVTIRPSSPEQLFGDLSQLQPFDTVVLANVPREHFTDAQIQMLVRNTQNLGGGLVMLGGPNSFGAGGWTNTPLEEAMPVDFQIKNPKVAPIGALALLMHASELANGNHWQKVIAREAIKGLSAHDYCGLLHWSDQTGTDAWLWNQPKGMLRVGTGRNRMLSLLDRMNPGDMPQFDPAMRMADAGLRQVTEAAVRHMIIISDGDPVPPSAAVIGSLKQQKVKISTVAVGTHGPANSKVLQDIAQATGGTHYVVNNPAMLPRIYQKEARRVSRPLVYERLEGMTPQVAYPHEMLSGLSDFPPIKGYVMTTKKDSNLVEVGLISPEPKGDAQGVNNTILASWTYGLGRSVAFTSDSGKRWATSWTAWDGYDKFFSQMIRWSMRPVEDTGKYAVATETVDGKIRVVVTALDKDDQFVNFLEMGGTIVGPSMKPLDIEMRQTAPGRYIGEVDAKDKGSYFILLSPGAGKAPIRVGASVPYSDEFRIRDTDEPLLKALADTLPKGGTAGQFIDAPAESDLNQRVAKLLDFNSFRHDLPKATSSQPIWPLLVLAASCLFFGDVFLRRVTVSLAWLAPTYAAARDFVLRRQAVQAESPMMERLRSSKAQVDERLEQRRAATRFEPSPDALTAPRDLSKSAAEQATGDLGKPVQPPAQPKLMAPQEEAESYTSRLLKAKKQVWEERKDDKRGDQQNG